MFKQITKKIAIATNVLLFLQLSFLGLAGNAASVYAATSSSAGPNTATTIIDDNTVGSSFWATPTLARESNDIYATTILSNSIPSRSHYLKATNYGFAVPADATVTGIELNIERHQTCTFGGCSSTVNDNTVRLIKNNVVTGNNKAQATAWGTSDGVVTYGSASDLWGTTWTPTEINSANFGAVLSAQRTTGGTRTLYVDAMTVKVYYTTNILPTAPTLIAPAEGFATKNSNVTFSWLPASDGDGDSLQYIISIVGDNGYSGSQFAVSGFTTTLPEGNYTWQVRATDAVDSFGPWTSAQNFKVDLTAPHVTVNPFNTDPTNQNVVVTATTDEGVLNADTHTFTGNGCFLFYATDAVGNVGQSQACVNNIDKVAPTVIVSSYDINPTNHDITVNAATTEGILNETSHTFTDNGCFTFEATDAAGNVGTKEVCITNIDKTPPTIMVIEYNTAPTNQDVVVTATTNEGTLNEDSHTFTENGCFTFVATDEAGNVSDQEVCIDNIDKVAPTGTVTYDINTLTNKDVVATLTPSEEVTVTNNGGLFTHTFTANGTFTFEFVDAAGNTGSATATVEWIDKEKPVITLADEKTEYQIEAGANDFELPQATAEDNLDGDITPFVKVDSNVNQAKVGNYTITYTVQDAASNDAEPVVVKVKVIDSTNPKVTFVPVKLYLTDLTKDFVFKVNSDEAITFDPALMTFTDENHIAIINEGVKVKVSDQAKYEKTKTVTIPVNFFDKDTYKGNHKIASTLKAVEENGNAVVVNFEILIDTVAPNAVLGLAGTVNDDGALVLTWTLPDPKSDYDKLVVKRDGIEIASLTGDVITYTDSSVTRGTSYKYEVVAYDAAGNSTTVTPISVDVPVLPAPAVVEQTAPTSPTAGEQLTTPTTNDQEVKAATTENKDETKTDDKKSNNLPLWGLLLLVVLACIGGYLYFSDGKVKDEQKKTTVKNKK